MAFTDARRFGRIRLVDCPGEDIRKHSPLVENGPDPVVDKDVFTEEYLKQKMRKRHVPIKALLLDQTTISGIGNWVGDEIIYQARLHPEQHCDEFDDNDVATLYKAVKYVCDTAVELLGDSDKFPGDWLFNHRWGKGKKDSASVLPNGEKIAFLTVGGRTSCIVPNLQKKKKGRAALPDADAESLPSESSTESKFFANSVKQVVCVSQIGDVDGTAAVTKKRRRRKQEEQSPPTDSVKKSKKPKSDEVELAKHPQEPGRRRSQRLGGRA